VASRPRTINEQPTSMMRLLSPAADTAMEASSTTAGSAAR
jgi:hypothetical protein